MTFINIVQCCLLVFIAGVAARKGKNIKDESKFIIATREQFTSVVQRELEKRNFQLLTEITPTVFVYKLKDSQNESKLAAYIKDTKERFKDEILEIQPVKSMEVVMLYKKHLNKRSVQSIEQYITLPPLEEENRLLVCNHYYDMHVEEAWNMNYTGRGILIAVLDVGVNPNVSDLVNNLDMGSSFNFFTKDKDISPEYFPDYPDHSFPSTNHGTSASSLIASEKGNNLCSAGIAHGSKLAVLKTFQVEWHGMFKPMTTSDILASGLSFKSESIDIYSNSWTSTVPFQQLDLGTRNAIKYGTEQGRGGKGSIYIFPAGPVGDGFSNSIYTIIVNSVGINGTIPEFVMPSAAAITSTLGEGNTLKKDYMITASGWNNCTTTFMGTSASTAMAAGIIALALEANSNLSWRDIQHLLVRSSEHTSLEQSDKFKKNGAGYYYHSAMGFGLLNAAKLVSQSQVWNPVHELLSVTCNSVSPGTAKPISQDVQVKSTVTMPVDCQSVCVDAVEHVLVNVSYIVTIKDSLQISLVSPSGTESILVDIDQAKPNQSAQRNNVVLKSVHFWGENPAGLWTLVMSQGNLTTVPVITAVSMTIYGTSRNTTSNISKQNCSNKNNLMEPQKSTVSTRPSDDSNENILFNIYRYVNMSTSFSFIMIIITVLIVIAKILGWDYGQCLIFHAFKKSQPREASKEEFELKLIHENCSSSHLNTVVSDE